MIKPKINIQEVSRYLGYKSGEVPKEMLEEIYACEKMLNDCISPKTHHKVFGITKGENITIENTTLQLSGNSAKSLLADCDRCVLLIATLGSGADQLIRKLQITNLSNAVTADFCASSMVEDLMNQFEDCVKGEILRDGEYFTDRFSLGYGDMPLSLQGRFCEVLNASKTVGVNVNQAGIMIPRKTITAVIGIANKPQKKKIKGCAFCDFRADCQYKKEGKFCD